jgi:hypothetical protein
MKSLALKIVVLAFAAASLSACIIIDDSGPDNLTHQSR